jgi:hypothetical protein
MKRTPMLPSDPTLPSSGPTILGAVSAVAILDLLSSNSYVA